MSVLTCQQEKSTERNAVRGRSAWRKGDAHTVQLAQSTIVREFGGLNSIPVVFDGTVPSRVIDGHIDLCCAGVECIFDEATNHVVERGNDDRGLDLRHDIPW